VILSDSALRAVPGLRDGQETTDPWSSTTDEFVDVCRSTWGIRRAGGPCDQQELAVRHRGSGRRCGVAAA